VCSPAPQSLLYASRPHLVIHYDSIRTSRTLSLSVSSHNRVIDAYFNLLHPLAVKRYWRAWRHAERELECTPNHMRFRQPPDARTYISMINFYDANPTFLSKSTIGEIFSFLQRDGTILSDYHIAKLFSFAKHTHYITLALNMLRWFCPFTTQPENGSNLA
jgi:hypothetical protein